MAFSYSKKGYQIISLRSNGKKKHLQVHRLVACAFVFNLDNKPQVNHKNGIKDDNRVENLEWCTNKENAIHAFKIGLHKPMKGENHPNAKLTYFDVEEIRRLFKTSKYTKEELGKKFGVNGATIGLIIRMKIWRVK